MKTVLKKILKKIIPARFHKSVKLAYTNSKKGLFAIIGKTAAAVGAGFDTQAKLLPPNQLNMLIYFDPNEVIRCIKRGKKIKMNNAFCCEGNWDQNECNVIEEEAAGTVRTIHQLFVEKIPYQETVQYQKMKRAIESGHPNPNRIGAYWCRSIDDIDVYFSILINAYDKIRIEGYKTQSELAQKGVKCVRHLKDEIQLFIARDGELILGRGGTHRLIIAQLLQLPVVPGLIRRVHKEWARACYNHFSEKSLEDNIRLGICEKTKLRSKKE